MQDLQGVRIGSILGIPLRLYFSVIIIFAIIPFSLATAALPELADGYRPAEYWTVGIAAAVLFFVSLLAHELSHSVVARRKDIGVRDITLWLFGGVSTIEGEAHSPRDEFEIAVAGPAMSFALAFTGIALGAVTAAAGAPELVVASFAWLGTINLILAVFNLVPAAPLDGGRVLHALLWKRRGDRTSALVTAARAGRGFAWVLVTLGIAEIWLLGSVGGVWLILMGWFLFTAARAEETQAILLRDLAGVPVRAVMTSHPITVPEDISVATLLHDYVLQHRCSAFPVVNAVGAPAGLVTLTRLRAVPVAARETTSVRAIAWPVASVTCAEPGELLIDVLRTAGEGGDGRILVVDHGEVVGIVSPTDVTRAVQASELAHAA